MSGDDISDGIRQLGRFDATAAFEAEACRLVRAAPSCALPPGAGITPCMMAANVAFCKQMWLIAVRELYSCPKVQQALNL